ncbi:MAG: peptidoglycan-associated lipoprotein Pal [Myxococcota bacterium]
MSLDLATVYFDFDRSEIRQDARRVLRSNAETLKQADANITIEGHCDERGNEEYNLALGDRRASAVKKYLVNVGVSGSRMRTISYGESKPAVSGHDESAWRWNRSTQFRTNR